MEIGEGVVLEACAVGHWHRGANRALLRSHTCQDVKSYCGEVRKKQGDAVCNIGGGHLQAQTLLTIVSWEFEPMPLPFWDKCF